MSKKHTVQPDIRCYVPQPTPVLNPIFIIIPWACLLLVTAAVAGSVYFGQEEKKAQAKLKENNSIVDSLMQQLRDKNAEFELLEDRRYATMVRASWIANSFQSHGLFTEAFLHLAKPEKVTERKDSVPVMRLATLEIKSDRERRLELFITGLGDEEDGQIFSRGLEGYLMNNGYTSQQLRSADLITGWGFRGFFSPTDKKDF